MQFSIKQSVKTIAAITAFTAISILSSSKTLSQTNDYPTLKQGVTNEIITDTSKHGRIYRVPPRSTGAIKGMPVSDTSEINKVGETIIEGMQDSFKIISNKEFLNKKDVLEILNPEYKDKLGIIGTDKDSLYLHVDYGNENIKKICKNLGFSGVVHAVLLPVNKEAYDDFAKEAKKHSAKYKKNPLSYTDSLIVAKSAEGDVFYLLLGVARNTGDASRKKDDATQDKWRGKELIPNSEILIPFDGEFGYMTIANWGKMHTKEPLPLPEPNPKIDTVVVKDTVYQDKPVFVPIILALNLEGFEMMEKNLYFNVCYNYLLDFRGKSPDEIMQLYDEWLVFKKTTDVKRASEQQTKYLNSFEGY